MSRGSSPMRASSPHSSSSRRRRVRVVRGVPRPKSTPTGERDVLVLAARLLQPRPGGRLPGDDGWSRSTGTPVELSFAWQRRQGVQRCDPVRSGRCARRADGRLAARVSVRRRVRGGHEDHRGRQPTRAVVLADPGRPRGHQQPEAGRRTGSCPRSTRSPRTGLPSPEYVPTSDPEPVVRWIVDAVRRNGSAALTGYASSLTAAARWASEHGITLDGVVAYPSSEPVTVGKLAGDAGAGMRPYPTYAFTARRHVALSCESATTRSTTSGTTSSR